MVRREEEGLEIVGMGKRELAVLYAPELEPRSAVNRLVRWMEASPGLMARLASTGYRRTQRMLSPRQVGLIVEHLGEP